MTFTDWRRRLGMTQTELAKNLDKNVSHLSRLENGKAKMTKQTELALECLWRRQGKKDQNSRGEMSAIDKQMEDMKNGVTIDTKHGSIIIDDPDFCRTLALIVKNHLACAKPG